MCKKLMLICAFFLNVLLRLKYWWENKCICCNACGNVASWINNLFINLFLHILGGVFWTPCHGWRKDSATLCCQTVRSEIRIDWTPGNVTPLQTCLKEHFNTYCPALWQQILVHNINSITTNLRTVLCESQNKKWQPVKPKIDMTLFSIQQ